MIPTPVLLCHDQSPRSSASRKTEKPHTDKPQEHRTGGQAPHQTPHFRPSDSQAPKVRTTKAQGNVLGNRPTQKCECQRPDLTTKAQKTTPQTPHDITPIHAPRKNAKGVSPSSPGLVARSKTYPGTNATTPRTATRFRPSPHAPAHPNNTLHHLPHSPAPKVRTTKAQGNVLGNGPTRTFERQRPDLTTEAQKTTSQTQHDLTPFTIQYLPLIWSRVWAQGSDHSAMDSESH